MDHVIEIDHFLPHHLIRVRHHPLKVYSTIKYLKILYENNNIPNISNKTDNQNIDSVLPEHSISQYVPPSMSKYSESEFWSSMIESKNFDNVLSGVSEEHSSGDYLEDPFGYAAKITNTVDKPAASTYQNSYVGNTVMSSIYPNGNSSAYNYNSNVDDDTVDQQQLMYQQMEVAKVFHAMWLQSESGASSWLKKKKMNKSKKGSRSDVGSKGLLWPPPTDMELLNNQGFNTSNMISNPFTTGVFQNNIQSATQGYLQPSP